MTLLVTGARGFVMSNLLRTWLLKHPDERAVVVDTGEADASIRDFLGNAMERVTWLLHDVRDTAAWGEAAREAGVDRIAHGAALTPHAWTDDAGIRHDRERDEPEVILDVNLGGTLAVLGFAGTLPVCRRFLLVSTGSVYGNEGPEGPLPEDGYVAPVALYGISKFAAEMVVRRFGQLHGLPVVAGRLASVYGPMDRVLPSRHVVCKPNAMTELALAGEPLLLNSAEPVGDYISVTDVAEALCLLVDAEQTEHFAYNVALGEAVGLGALAEMVCRLVPGSEWRVEAESANLTGDPTKLRGQWGAYDISRLAREFGWKPRPLTEGLTEYVQWRRDRRAAGLPI